MKREIKLEQIKEITSMEVKRRAELLAEQTGIDIEATTDFLRNYLMKVGVEIIDE